MLVKAWAGMKSLKPKNEDRELPASGGRNEEVDFHGEKRSNQTHISTSDPDAMIYREGSGIRAKLCFIGHALMETFAARPSSTVTSRLRAASAMDLYSCRVVMEYRASQYSRRRPRSRLTDVLDATRRAFSPMASQGPYQRAFCRDHYRLGQMVRALLRDGSLQFRSQYRIPIY